MFAMTSLAAVNHHERRVASLDKAIRFGEKSGDTLGMVGDSRREAVVLTEMGKAAEAQAALSKALKPAESSTLPDAIKGNIALFHQRQRRAALARKDVNAAKAEAARVLRRTPSPFRQQLSGQAGMSWPA